MHKAPKDNEKRRKQVCFNEKGNFVCDNGKNNSDQKIYASMSKMSGNDECPSEKLGTVHNGPIGFWILEQRATQHQKFHISFQVH